MTRSKNNLQLVSGETAPVTVDSAPGAVGSSEPLSLVAVRAPAALDPHREHAEFPDRWRAYILDHFGAEPRVIASHFQVSQRCARKWIKGETGCNGSQVAIAVRTHPDTAPDYLFGVAAE